MIKKTSLTLCICAINVSLLYAPAKKDPVVHPVSIPVTFKPLSETLEAKIQRHIDTLKTENPDWADFDTLETLVKDYNGPESQRYKHDVDQLRITRDEALPEEVAKPTPRQLGGDKTIPPHVRPR